MSVAVRQIDNTDHPLSLKEIKVYCMSFNEVNTQFI